PPQPIKQARSKRAFLLVTRRGVNASSGARKEAQPTQRDRKIPNPAPQPNHQNIPQKIKISKLKETADHCRHLRARENNPAQSTTTKAHQSCPMRKSKPGKTAGDKTLNNQW
ncbi:hypothetical protein, partial [Agrobacterium sp. Azo12]|uniref:hypothetical protein n=1 Tax=Agrobacterium sp. Azo12 TaxID=3031129 RepID=UPI0026E041C0